MNKDTVCSLEVDLWIPRSELGRVWGLQCGLVIGLLGNTVACLLETDPDFVKGGPLSTVSDKYDGEESSEGANDKDESDTDLDLIFESPHRGDISEESDGGADAEGGTGTGGEGDFEGWGETDAGDDGGFIVINEVNVGEGWIEFYNNASITLSLNGMSFANSLFINGEDVSNVFNFPSGIEIGPQEYLVMIEDKPDSYSFDLDQGSDSLELYSGINGTGEILDSTSWTNVSGSFSWGRSPNGVGAFTLTIASPGMENKVTE